MNLRTLGYAVAAGIASFLVVLVAVSELLAQYVEFSVLVGIPAGLVVGAAVAAFVLLQIGSPDRTHRSLALALGTFGVVLLVVLLVALGLSLLPVSLAVVVGTALGALAGVAAFVWDRRRPR